MSSNARDLVSVVMPTYDHSHFLGRALRSVLDQTYKNWEIIVVDNHSQDNTREVVLKFKDPRVTFLQIYNNGVIAASRNMGIREAKGEWIAFLDSDDFWYPRKLEVVMNEFQKNLSINVCSTDKMLVDETTGNRQLLQYGPYHRNFYKELLVKGNCLSPSATVVRRSFLNNSNIFFRENVEFATAEDYDLWMMLAKAGAKVKFIHSVQGEFLIHKNNNSGQIERHTQNIMNVIRDHVYEMQEFEPDTDRLWRNINARLLMASSKDLIIRKQFVAGAKGIVKAVNHSLSGSIGYFCSRISKSIRKLFN